MRWLVKVVALGWIAWGVFSLIWFMAHGRFHPEPSSFGPGAAFITGLGLAMFPVFVGVGLWNRSAWAWWYAVLITGLCTVLIAVAFVIHPKAGVSLAVSKPWASLVVLGSRVLAFVVLVIDAVMGWRREESFSFGGFLRDPMRGAQGRTSRERRADV